MPRRDSAAPAAKPGFDPETGYPYDDEPVTDEQRKAISQGVADDMLGRTRPLAAVARDLGVDLETDKT